ncbi:class I SAM-dependent methyltransferase [Tibeticola sp.]|uniref:class I SAM-dependent methyltransferase n=1 Tax=Tibeticola sp. TaxID=2005368 RepID=UPI0025874136|nr:class I SAM-dependent methyltransferase [Tibeticola sp.]MCI4441540.1 methyltransferase domain-containing protein [Tibeticola sp.]
MHEWFQTPPGQHLLRWERGCLDASVSDVFGYHAIQLGLSDIDGLAANRMPHRWLALDQAELPAAQDQAGNSPKTSERSILGCDYAALPFPEQSIDLVVLPHTLELHRDAHACLREVERVLVPEGRVVVCGLNPASLWGLRQRRARLLRRLGLGELFLPDAGEFIAYWRLRDWLRLLGFEVETVQFGVYVPALRQSAWLQRFRWMDRAGARWWPIFGAAYCVTAVKKVRGVRLLEASWKAAPSPQAAPITIANKTRNTQGND